jgi:uncharacterized RDD family membrane protein YckC
MSTIQFKCPHCTQLLNVPANAVGRIIQCPLCKGQITLPAPTPPPVIFAEPGPIAHASHRDPNGCILCGKTKYMHKTFKLYDRMVCKKCYYGFANKRQLAFGIDVLFWNGFCFCIGIALGIMMVVMGATEKEIDNAASIIGWLVLPIFLFKDSFFGYSLGKLICGVRIIDNNTGAPTGVAASIKRTLPLLIPFMPLIVAFQLCKGHRIGDGWSNSKVIWNKYASYPPFQPDRTTA